MKLRLTKPIRRLIIVLNILVAQTLFVVGKIEFVILFIKLLDKESTKIILRKFGAQIENKCDIESGITIHNADSTFSNLIIEEYCHIGKDVFLDLQAKVVIREKSTISMRSIILTHMDVGHAGPFSKHYSRDAQSVEIGPRAYVGSGAIILPGVRIGEGSIVGAGALVNRDVPSGTVVAGVPARQICEIPDKLSQEY